jgi:hypothetical protein
MLHKIILFFFFVLQQVVNVKAQKTKSSTAKVDYILFTNTLIDSGQL